MGNSTAGKFWLLDSAGVVVDTPVYVKRVAVTWKTGSAGTLDIATFNREDGTGQTFVYGQTLGASSAAVDQLTQIIEVDNWVAGMRVVTIADVAKCIVHIK